MAVYKVPQDVEADDKLLGPFSFRQFIYLIIVAISGLVAWVLAQIFILLIIIPLPIIAVFLILALPLKKDQPMETYAAAMVKFFLKPKKRLWQPDGTVNLVEIVAPKVIEEQRYKDISQDDAQSRFNYLAQVMDTRGWATRGVLSANDAIADSVIAEAGSAEDVMDSSTTVSQDFNALLEQQEQRQRQDAMLRMQQAKTALAAAQQSAITNPLVIEPSASPSAPHAQPATQQPVAEPDSSAGAAQNVTFKPYPTMHQHVLDPSGSSSQPAPITPPPAPVKNDPPAPVPTQVSPDILKLANNTDLSISAIAHEAHRLEQQDEHEVVIKLR